MKSGRCHLNGEMSEWLKEHAWKTNPASGIKCYQNISSRNRIKDFPPQNASRCEPVNGGVCRRFQRDLTQFLHNSHLHLLDVSRCSSVRVFPRRLIRLIARL